MLRPWPFRGPPACFPDPPAFPVALGIALAGTGFPDAALISYLRDFTASDKASEVIPSVRQSSR